MSGQLIFKTRHGRSRDPRYYQYIEWYMEVVGEDGVKTRLSPTYNEFSEFIRQVLIHEFRNDATRKRKKELAVKYKALLGELYQMEIDMADIPEQYFVINTMRPFQSNTDILNAAKQLK